MAEEQVTYYKSTETGHVHSGKPFYEKTWFWIVVVIIILLIVAVLIIIIYVASRGDGNNQVTNGKTIITFNSQDASPIDAFQSLNVANGSILPATPPIESTPPALSFTANPTSSFIIFNKGGIKGVGVSGVSPTSNPQLIINVDSSANIGSVAFRVYELSNVAGASIVVAVTAKDGTVANTNIVIPQFGVSYIGISTSIPNIQQIVLQRGNGLEFGLSIIQFGNVF